MGCPRPGSRWSVDSCCCPFQNLLAGLLPANPVQPISADKSFSPPLTIFPMSAAPLYPCCKRLLDSYTLLHACICANMQLMPVQPSAAGRLLAHNVVHADIRGHARCHPGQPFSAVRANIVCPG